MATKKASADRRQWAVNGCSVSLRNFNPGIPARRPYAIRGRTSKTRAGAADASSISGHDRRGGPEIVINGLRLAQSPRTPTSMSSAVGGQRQAGATQKVQTGPHGAGLATRVPGTTQIDPAQVVARSTAQPDAPLRKHAERPAVPECDDSKDRDAAIAIPGEP